MERNILLIGKNSKKYILSKMSAVLDGTRWIKIFSGGVRDRKMTKRGPPSHLFLAGFFLPNILSPLDKTLIPAGSGSVN